MCGIWVSIGKPVANPEYSVSQLEDRGPEGTRIVNGNGYQLGFTRLAINGLSEAGMQPMSFGSMQWVCNGEIYNWKTLAVQYDIGVESDSDCEVLGELLTKLAPQTDGATFFRSLDGVFAFACVDASSDSLWVARDPYGVRPLFVGYALGPVVQSPDSNKKYISVRDGIREVTSILFGSTLKSLASTCEIIEPFPPGHYAVYNIKTLERIGFEAYHTVPWLKTVGDNVDDACASIRKGLTSAVTKRLMAERPVAALLSGGIDSSIVAALLQKSRTDAGEAPLKTFSIGFEGSEDLRYARIVANHIGSDHTEIIKTPQDFFDAIPDVIQAIESYDITTVRASIGNWLVSKEIKERTDCKVVFNGDGADEIFGSYMYFYNAPSDQAFEYETERLLKDIHYFDVLRSDRSISSHGLEARTPFLDKQFVNTARSLSTFLRRPTKYQCEKWILRKAFEGTNLLPLNVIWRRKEAFSDGVSGKEKFWFQECQERAEGLMGPRDTWPADIKGLKYLPPQTAEAAYYRTVFQRWFGKKYDHVTVPYHWMPKWSGSVNDPSAKMLDISTNGIVGPLVSDDLSIHSHIQIR